jgi:hypothetical protein
MDTEGRKEWDNFVKGTIERKTLSRPHKNQKSTLATGGK